MTKQSSTSVICLKQYNIAVLLTSKVTSSKNSDDFLGEQLKTRKSIVTNCERCKIDLRLFHITLCNTERLKFTKVRDVTHKTRLTRIKWNFKIVILDRSLAWWLAQFGRVSAWVARWSHHKFYKVMSINSQRMKRSAIFSQESLMKTETVWLKFWITLTITGLKIIIRGDADSIHRKRWTKRSWPSRTLLQMVESYSQNKNISPA